ncbi:MAG: mechanosensitive ion channel [Sedimentisphaerales bacterium]|nr:mechanosensitive ion channel [Sedimentisphaerales bacterium]
MVSGDTISTENHAAYVDSINHIFTRTFSGRISIIPNNFLVGGHFKEPSGWSNANERISIRQTLSARNIRRIEIRFIIRISIAPDRLFRSEGFSFHFVIALVIHRKNKLINR